MQYNTIHYIHQSHTHIHVHIVTHTHIYIYIHVFLQHGVFFENLRSKLAESQKDAEDLKAAGNRKHQNKHKNHT